MKCTKRRTVNDKFISVRRKKVKDLDKSRFKNYILFEFLGIMDLKLDKNFQVRNSSK